MVQVTAQQLIDQVRLESALFNNQVVTDSQILSLLTEAYHDMRDRLLVRFAYWFRAEAPFMLTGGSDYTFDLTTVPDFQVAQGLDLQTSPQIWFTVPMLASYAERNQYNATWPFPGMDAGYTGFLGRKYWIDGDRLEVLSPQNAAGTYRLVYTPIAESIQTPVTVAWNLAAAANATNNAGTIQYNFGSSPGNHPAFVNAMLGGTITVTFGAPNTAWNCTSAVITGPPLPATGNSIQTGVTWPGGSFTSPASGTASITYQPAGTINLLPAKLTPWSQYLVLYAAIAVKNSRDQDPTALMERYQDIRQRLIDLTKQRSEGVRQAPITRPRFGRYGSGGYGW